jgi:hypothetical protein
VVKICEAAGVWAGNVSTDEDERDEERMAGNLWPLFSAVNERNRNPLKVGCGASSALKCAG